MRGIESKRCEDSLCVDCVPGFCRQRPVPPTHPPVMSRTLHHNTNHTINRIHNQTIGHNIASNQTHEIIGVNVTQISEFPNNLTDVSDFENFLSPELANMSSNLNSTDGSPVIATTSPPQMCLCSWV